MSHDDPIPKPWIPIKIVKYSLLHTKQSNLLFTHGLLCGVCNITQACEGYREKRTRLAGRQLLVLLCSAGQSTQPEALFPTGLQARLTNVGGTRLEFQNGPIIFSLPVHSYHLEVTNLHSPIHHCALHN
jgi:hypothetical protein